MFCILSIRVLSPLGRVRLDRNFLFLLVYEYDVSYQKNKTRIPGTCTYEYCKEKLVSPAGATQMTAYAWMELFGKVSAPPGLEHPCAGGFRTPTTAWHFELNDILRITLDLGSIVQQYSDQYLLGLM